MHIEGNVPPCNKYFFNRYLTGRNIVSAYKIEISKGTHTFWDDERNIEDTIRKIKYMKSTKKKTLSKTKNEKISQPPQALIWSYPSKLGAMYTIEAYIPEDIEENIQEDVSGNQNI